MWLSHAVKLKSGYQSSPKHKTWKKQNQYHISNVCRIITEVKAGHWMVKFLVERLILHYVQILGTLWGNKKNTIIKTTQWNFSTYYS